MSVATRIPLSEPTMSGLEASYVQECIDESWIAAKGRFVHEFEQLFARLHEYPAAVSTVSGTAALHLALIALGLGPGDEVLVPAMTFVATANAVRYTGATPVFVDADPVTYTIDPADLQAKISARTRAILVVHLFGHPADMDAIGELARAHELAVVEDASGALGARYRGRPCGTLGDIGCFSFNGNKIVTSGGGGMLLAAEPKRLEHMRHLSFQARLAGTFEYVHDEVAFNYALSNVHAAIGLAQLERLDELLAHRRALAARYAAGLADVAGLTFCAQAPWARCNYWLMSVLVDAAEYGRSREQLMAALAGVGIESRPFFVPLPDVGAHLRESPAHVPVARRLHREGLSIPSSASLDEADQDRVIAALRADL